MFNYCFTSFASWNTEEFTSIYLFRSALFWLIFIRFCNLAGNFGEVVNVELIMDRTVSLQNFFFYLMKHVTKMALFPSDYNVKVVFVDCGV